MSSTTVVPRFFLLAAFLLGYLVQTSGFMLRSPTRAAYSRGHTSLSMADSTTKVLFVCLGNICRSPAAEGVFKDVVEKSGLSSEYTIDSCGTGGGKGGWYKEGGTGFHTGNPSDARMIEAAKKRGVNLTSISRPMVADDLVTFDHILCMDGANVAAVTEAAHYWGKSPLASEKVKTMTSFCTKKKAGFVPDPYYGGADGFEEVLDILEDACQGLLSTIRKQD